MYVRNRADLSVNGLALTHPPGWSNTSVKDPTVFQAYLNFPYLNWPHAYIRVFEGGIRSSARTFALCLLGSPDLMQFGFNLIGLWDFGSLEFLKFGSGHDSLLSS